MDFKAEDKISEIFEKLDLRAPQRSLPPQPSDGGSGNPNYNIGPIYIYAPGDPGSTGGGSGGSGGPQVDSSKAIVSSKMSESKASITKSDMSAEMQEYALDCATLAFIKHKDKLDIAVYIKEKFMKQYNGTWHCIVGPGTFAFTVHNSTRRFINFNVGEDRILLFGTG